MDDQEEDSDKEWEVFFSDAKVVVDNTTVTHQSKFGNV